MAGGSLPEWGRSLPGQGRSLSEWGGSTYGVGSQVVAPIDSVWYLLTASPVERQSRPVL